MFPWFPSNTWQALWRITPHTRLENLTGHTFGDAKSLLDFKMMLAFGPHHIQKSNKKLQHHSTISLSLNYPSPKISQDQYVYWFTPIFCISALRKSLDLFIIKGVDCPTPSPPAEHPSSPNVLHPRRKGVAFASGTVGCQCWKSGMLLWSTRII